MPVLFGTQGVLGMTETTEPQPAAKPKKKYKLAEKKITKKITDWLKTLEGCWYYKVSGGSGFMSNGRMVMSRPGVPDLCCCYQGRTVWFEVKSLTGRLSKVQQEEIARMKEAGARVFTVRSLEDVKFFLLGEVA
jgi:hypothetical protein